MAGAVEELHESVRRVAVSAEASALAGREALEAAQQGDRAVRASLEGIQRIRGEVQGIARKMKSLGDRSMEISEIVDTIREIAMQTDLLALNAAIEAAGAGEAGLRFAAVAEEVRKLAERAAQATRHIATLIKNIQLEMQEAVVATEQGAGEVENGYRIAVETGRTFKDIAESVQRSAGLCEDIFGATQQQVQSAERVAASTQSIAVVAVQTEQAVVRTRKTAEELGQLAQQLTASLARFKLAS
jgi:twitching motility protein PilJ